MTDLKISQQQFDHIAKLSGLTIGPNEQFIADQLSQAAQYVEIIQELDTTSIVPTFQVNNQKNVLRPDVVTPSLPQEVALSQATSTYHGFFVTQATIKK